MAEPLIPGGCILLARKIIESAIWDKPPLYLKVWVYLLALAQHKEYKNLERGQLRTSIPDIIEACKWKVGARTERPTKDQIFQILEWLRNPDERGYESNAKATMITTTKATHGLLVNIDNYGFYQDFKNYESNDESDGEKSTEGSRRQRQPDNINKNVNNDKNDNKKAIYTVFDFWNSKKITVHREMPEAMAKAINARLQVHSVDALLETIQNYHTCLVGDEYYYTHKFTLKDFMNPKNLDRFLTENSPFETFRRNNWTGGKGTASTADIDDWVKKMEEGGRK